MGPGWADCGPGLLIRAFSSLPLRLAVAQGEEGPAAGWVSTDYGTRTAAPAIVYSATGPLPARIVTLLLPVERLRHASPVSPLLESDTLVGLRLVAPAETIRLDGLVAGLERR